MFDGYPLTLTLSPKGARGKGEKRNNRKKTKIRKY
jgi:hypothetical protein